MFSFSQRGVQKKKSATYVDTTLAREKNKKETHVRLKQKREKSLCCLCCLCRHRRVAAKFTCFDKIVSENTPGGMVIDARVFLHEREAIRVNHLRHRQHRQHRQICNLY